MLAPLSVGEYTISFGGENLFGTQNTTYNITVTPVPEPTSLLSLVAVSILGAISLQRKTKIDN